VVVGVQVPGKWVSATSVDTVGPALYRPSMRILEGTIRTKKT